MIIQKEFNREGGRERWNEREEKSTIAEKKLFAVFKILNESLFFIGRIIVRRRILGFKNRSTCGTYEHKTWVRISKK